MACKGRRISGIKEADTNAKSPGGFQDENRQGFLRWICGEGVAFWWAEVPEGRVIGRSGAWQLREPGRRAPARSTPPTADAGRRPLQGVLSTEEPMKKKGIQAASMTRPATAETEIRQVDKHQPPSNYAAREVIPVFIQSFRRAPVSHPPYFFFSFGPCTARFLFFFWQEKEKMGGAKHQPSSWLKSPPPARASTSPYSGEFSILAKKNANPNPAAQQRAESTASPVLL